MTTNPPHPQYLIQVPNDKPSLSLVPATWAKLNGTKRVSRFHTPTTTRLLRERDQHKESLTAACNTAYASLLTQIAAHYHPLRDTLTALATLDCLFSLATVAAQPGYCKPTFTPTPTIDLVAARHPMIEKLLAAPYIPTTTTLSTDATRALIITGPNMGGKSSYLRLLALVTIMAQIGSYVPAASARLGIVDAVYTRMGARDNMMNAESTFMVELTETAAILRCATRRSLVVLDELGRGTSTCDGVAIAGAVLEYVLGVGCLCLFATHYAALAGRAGKGEGVGARYMKFSEAGGMGSFFSFCVCVGWCANERGGGGEQQVAATTSRSSMSSARAWLLVVMGSMLRGSRGCRRGAWLWLGRSRRCWRRR